MRQRITLFVIYSLIMGPLAAQQPPKNIRPEPGQSWTYHPQHGWGLTDVQNGMRFTMYYGGSNRQYPVNNGGAPIRVGNPTGGRPVGGGGVALGGTLYYNPNQRLPPSLPQNPNLYRSPFMDLNRGNWAPQAIDAFRNVVLNPQLKMPDLKLPGGADLTPDVKLQKEWIESVASTLSEPGVAPLVSKYISGPMKAVADRDPFALAESMDGYMNQIAALDAVDPKLAAMVTRVGQNVFMDSQGVISGLPDAPRPVDLVSPLTSDVGRAVRGNLNRMLVARQVLEGEHRIACESNPANCLAQEAKMEKVRDMFDQLALLNVMAERIGLASDAAFQLIKGELEKTALFTFGIAKGVYGSAEALAEGIEFMATHDMIAVTGDLAVKVGDALVNYKRTYNAISDAIGKKWDTFLYGNPVESGEVLGQAATEIFTTLIPGLKGATGAARALKSAALVEKGVVLAEKISLATKAGTYKIVKVAVDRAVTKVAVAKGLQEFVTKGAIAAENADMLFALNRVMPETAAQVMRLEQAGVDAVKLKAVAKESLKFGGSAAQADATVASLVANHGKDAVGLLNEIGPEALAGASKAFGATTLKTVSGWAKLPAAKEMAEMAKHVHRGLAVLPETVSPVKNLGNLFEVEAVMKTEGVAMTANGREFLVRQTMNADIILKEEGRVFGSVVSMTEAGRNFAKFETEIKNIPGIKVETEVWRGIPKERVDSAGKTIKATSQDVFRDPHVGNIKSDHRFSQPGEGYLYTTMGNEEAAKAVIAAENGNVPVNTLLYEKRLVKATNVLDLTDKAILIDKFKLSKELMTSASYMDTHQLGFLARKYGFDGIKAFSAKGDGVNLILPKGFP